MKRILILVMLCFFTVPGCWDQNATPVEKASIVSHNMSDTYVALYGSYKRFEDVLVGVDLERLKEVAPILNTAKKHLIAYNDIIIQWRKSGGDEPVELLINKNILNSLLAEASSLLLEFY